MGRSVLNIPTLVIDSIGAGAGQYLTIDPESKRVDIGPGSAGSEPGPVCYNTGNETPTVMDCALILGILNPDYYLGGKMKLRKDLALKAIKEKCADPLGVDPYQFAEGVIDLINTRMRDHILTVLSVRGYSPSDYSLDRLWRRRPDVLGRLYRRDTLQRCVYSTLGGGFFSLWLYRR